MVLKLPTSPLAVLDLVPGWVWAAGVAVLLAAAGVQTVRLAWVGTELATERTDRAQETLQRQEVYASDLRQLARNQATHAARQQEILDAHAKRAQERSTALAAVRADNLSLRGEIALYAAGGGRESQGDPAACSGERDRATTLGLLLDRTLQLAERHTAAAEKHADEVRTLKGIIANDRAVICGG